MFVHIVFATKYRQPVLASDWRPELFLKLRRMIQKYESEPIAINGFTDHVHILLNLSPKLAPSYFVNRIKTASSIWLSEKKFKPSQFNWQEGYAIFSVSPSVLKSAQAYIENQESHHSRFTFEDELEEWKREYGIAWTVDTEPTLDLPEIESE